MARLGRLEKEDGDFHKVDDCASRLSESQMQKKRPPEYGLCSKCEYLYYRKSRLFDHEVWCDRYYDGKYKPHLMPNRHDPIEECCEFYPSGQMTIQQMYQCATIIEIKKQTIGFAAENEVVIIRPEDREEKEGEI